MQGTKADIIAQLQKEILPLQGYGHSSANKKIDTGLGPINNVFPGNEFPLGAVHEFICESTESTAATGGFIAGILSALMKKTGTCIWISTGRKLFPPALIQFGIQPDRIIFIDLKKERDVLWAMEEALQCSGLAAVIAEARDLSFTASRRFQLAVEKSRVTGFIIRSQPKQLTSNACVTRWKISSLPSELPGNIPGVGFPRWHISLLKVRNGKPGSWELEWKSGRFYHINQPAISISELKRKTG